ncbi:MAG: NAD+ synthase [Candidatus Omnitrophica bacterium]|nr:NAD+ synthase [Candidatus Omnitrophota bacterium]
MQRLKIDSQKVERKLVRFIRDQVRKAAYDKVVLGLSGGLDSSIVAYLCCRALGPENVIGLILPYKTTSRKSIKLARLIADKYGIKTKTVSITVQVDIYFRSFPGADRVRRGNKMARERMSILYDQSKASNALVAGTGNKTECLLGYSTIYGDAACAFNPLGGLYKTQLRQFAKDVGIPKEIIRQTPTAGLWPGQSDEGELGVSYAKVDRLLYYLVDKKYSEKRLRNLGFSQAFIDKVKRMVAANRFKMCTPAIARI